MKLILTFLFFLLYFTTTYAKTNDNSQDVVTLKPIVVKGVLKGPGLWKVSNGENALWILGTLSPLPKKMIWESLEVESVIHDSQAYLLPTSVSADIGFFKGLSLATSVMGIKKNPDKKKLKDVLPEQTYQRWLHLKKKYLGKNRGVEKTRPIFASEKLFNTAIRKIGLTYNTKVEKKVRKLAKKNKLEFIRPNIKIDLNKPKSAIKKFKKSQISDLECFTKTLDRLEKDIDFMRLRANAWANGNIEALKNLTTTNQDKSCLSAILNNDIAKDFGIENIQQRSRDLWLEKVDEALNQYKSTFAIMPISSLFGEGNLLEVLSKKGYSIREPQ